MPVLRPINERDRTLSIPISRVLEQRLEEVRKRCQEKSVILPLDELFDEFLGNVLATAEAELDGDKPNKGGRPKKANGANGTTNTKVGGTLASATA